MALVSLPSVKDAKTIEEVIDKVENMRKQVEFLLNSIESDNVIGKLRANQIEVGNGTSFQTGFVENLGNMIVDWELTQPDNWFITERVAKANAPAGSPTEIVGRMNARDGYYGEWFPIIKEESFFCSVTACNKDSAYPFSIGIQFANEDETQLYWENAAVFQASQTTWANGSGVVKAPSNATKARIWFQIETFSNFGNWYFTRSVVKRQGAVLAKDLQGELNIAQNTIRRDSYFVWDKDGLRAIDPTDPSRYVLLTSGGMEVKKGMIYVERSDGFPTIIGGRINYSFDLQGSDPPLLVDSTVNGRFFETNNTDTNGATCNLYTFTRIARYVVFQVAIMSSELNQSTAILAQSGKENTWLASVSAFDTNESVKIFYVDLGVPDGSMYALKLMLKSYSTTNSAYCRKIRAYQTDFLP